MINREEPAASLCSLESESRLVLRDTKNRSDRNIGLPSSLLQPVARQIERVRSLWEEDRTNGLPVSLPGLEGLRRKYPSIPKNWGWYYLFPQHRPCRNPQALTADRHTLYRHHQGDWGIQHAVKVAAVKCGLEGVLTPHALRHAFATYLDARGERSPPSRCCSATRTCGPRWCTCIGTSPKWKVRSITPSNTFKVYSHLPHRLWRCPFR